MKDANMIKLERIAAYVRNHGFYARVENDAVTIRIEYMAPNTGTDYLEEYARTLSEARTILGY